MRGFGSRLPGWIVPAPGKVWEPPWPPSTRISGSRSRLWQALEAELGRGLLDELTAREAAAPEPGRLGASPRIDDCRGSVGTVEGDRIDGSQPSRATKWNDDLDRKHAAASVALREWQSKLAREHGELEGQVAGLGEIQAALPADAALIAWVDVLPIARTAVDPDGEHWGVVVRSSGGPTWVAIPGIRARRPLEQSRRRARKPRASGAKQTARRAAWTATASHREVTKPANRPAGEGPWRHDRWPATRPASDHPALPRHGGHSD